MLSTDPTDLSDKFVDVAAVEDVAIACFEKLGLVSCWHMAIIEVGGQLL